MPEDPSVERLARRKQDNLRGVSPAVAAPGTPPDSGHRRGSIIYCNGKATVVVGGRCQACGRPIGWGVL